MSSPSLQLDAEVALRDFIAAQNIGYTAAKIHSAHSREKVDTSGSYLGIIAEPPDWMIPSNPSARVRFEIFTAGIADHDKAPRVVADHSARVGAIIELFSQQNFRSALAALDALNNAGLGFTGWEQEPSEPDGTSPDGTQLIGKLSYIFDLYLKQ